MLRSLRTGLSVLALLAAATRLHAQASPYVPLDDPRLPLVEHLILRGVIADPSPMLRPFRQKDLLRVLAHPKPSASPADRALATQLRAWYAEKTGNRWRAAPRVGGEAYTHARRDLLHPAGPSGARPYAELGLGAVVGKVALVSRPVLQPRLIVDPDWPGRKDLKVAGRQAESYISAQFRWIDLFYGQMDRNWGPVGLPGIPLSNYSYGRPAIGFAVHTRAIRFSALASQLRDETDSITGALFHRYFFAHRLGVQLSPRLYVAGWETVVFAGADRSAEQRLLNPLSLSFLENAYGLGEESNSMLGLDLQWQAFGSTRLAAQLALDDFTYKNRSSPTRNPDRYAFTLMASGPLGNALGWRAWYTQASSLAFRTFDYEHQDFTDAGVGIGRNFADNDEARIQLSVPLKQHLLLLPDLTLLRQGQGMIDAPYPPSGSTALGSTPELFIGTVEKTWRAGLGLQGAVGPVEVTADGGYHHIVNADHVAGRTRNRFEARLLLTVGFTSEGALP